MWNTNINDMIYEQYCSFETAKLLKVKGFSCEEIHHVYRYYEEDDDYCYEKLSDYEKFDSKKMIAVPTLQTAMRWLREVHHKIIIINYGNVGHPDEPKLQWHWEILNIKGEFCECNISDGNETYEQACESAIKYCLENLI
jgi:hypothetical protein